MASIEDLPVQAPPPGKTSNFIDPERRGPAVIVVCYFFVLLMWPFLLLRLYSTFWVVRKYGWDDLWAILAALGITTFAACAIWIINKHALGVHEWDIRAITFTATISQIYTIGGGVVTYSIAVIFAKLALLVLFYRLFGPNHRTRMAIYLGICVNCSFYVACFIYFLVLCIPQPNSSWTSPQYSSRCHKATNLGIVQGVFGLVSDLYLFILPLPVLWGLQMPLRKKIGITAIFLTGLIAIIASGIGLYYRVLETWVPDLSWIEPPALALAVVEVTIGIICSSVPFLPPVFRRHAARLSSIIKVFHGLLSKTKHRNSSRSPFDNGNTPPKETTGPKMHVEREILGSIQGNGRFMRLGRSSPLWGTRSTTDHLDSVPGSENTTSATRRDFYEIPMNETLVSSSNRPLQPRANIQGGASSHTTPNNATVIANEAPNKVSSEPTKTNPGEVLGQATASSSSSQHENLTSHTSSKPDQESWRNLFWRRRRSERKGYWDLLSVFRSNGRSVTVTEDATIPSEKVVGVV